MSKIWVFVILGILLISLVGFVIAEQGNSSGNNECLQSGDSCCMDGTCINFNQSSCMTLDCPIKMNGCKKVENKCQPKCGCDIQHNNLTKAQIKEMVQEKNILKFENKTGEKCLEDCKCTGVVMKCDLGNGTRQMTVYAQSGNKIIITKTANASTTVELYKENGTLVGVFEGNKTKQIKMTPEQVREKIQEKLQSKLENENITLDKDGYYKYNANKMTKLFWIFPVKEKVQWNVDPETGEITKTKNVWWGFLAKDDKNKEQIVGASCGTVTPGYNDECCQNKGYDSWNPEKGECVFSEAE